MGEAKRRMFMAGDDSAAARAALKTAEAAAAQLHPVFEIKVQVLDDNRVNVRHPEFPPGQEVAAATAMVDLLAEAIQVVVKQYLAKEISPILAPPGGMKL
jgi:hypothetical protein